MRRELWVALAPMAMWVAASAPVQGVARFESSAAALDSVVPNDNRVRGGAMSGGVLRLRLVARHAAWRPDLGVDSAATVMAFAEEGGAPRIPGPLLRAERGARVVVSVRNALGDSTLVVHGLRAGTVVDDTVQVRPGESRDIAFEAGEPGTYLYWGTTTHSPIGDRPWRDSQLTGAIVVDPPGAVPDERERIFVMTVLDIYADDTVRNKAREDVWELAINGRSWPHTERLRYAVGDTVRWRWINGTYLPHPMHLHGFHFRVLAKGSGARDSLYRADARRLAVTELMLPGTTFALDWVPTRPGRWLFHCHMAPHITPFPSRADSARAHDAHDVERHPIDAMSGLVLGIDVTGPSAPLAGAPPDAQRVRLTARPADGTHAGHPRLGFAVRHDPEAPGTDTLAIPGVPLVLTRGRTAAITVVNELTEPTTVHWHGMELESVYDGVSGWSRTGGSIGPLIAPGDSFTAVMTPPRAGTFIYHTHMDEGRQLRAGMYGPLLVMEPGQRYDPGHDLLFSIGAIVADSGFTQALNGSRSPAPLELVAGRSYRLRFINILPAALITLALQVDSVPVQWRVLAKDGADAAGGPLPMGRAVLRLGVGETTDVEWTPAQPMRAELSVTMRGGTIVQPVVVRP